MKAAKDRSILRVRPISSNKSQRTDGDDEIDHSILCSVDDIPNLENLEDLPRFTPFFIIPIMLLDVVFYLPILFSFCSRLCSRCGGFELAMFHAKTTSSWQTCE